MILIEESVAHLAQVYQKQRRFAGEDLASAPLNDTKLRDAIAKERSRTRDAAEAQDDRKRKYNSFASTEMTAEEMEAYHRMKHRGDDPMASMLAADAEAATDEEA